MTATKRPPAARKSTRTNQQKTDDALSQGIALSDSDGTRLQVRIRDVKGTHDAQLMAATGYDFMGLLEATTRRQGLDLFTACLWFARIVNNRPTESYAEMLDTFGYEDFAALDMDQPEEAADGPKAPASNSSADSPA